jgi:hypothetical protein
MVYDNKNRGIPGALFVMTTLPLIDGICIYIYEYSIATALIRMIGILGLMAIQCNIAIIDDIELFEILL